MSLKLSHDLKLEILRLSNEGYSHRRIAKELGLGKTTVNDFINKNSHKSWWGTNKPIADGTYDHHHESIKRLS